MARSAPPTMAPAAAAAPAVPNTMPPPAAVPIAPDADTTSSARRSTAWQVYLSACEPDANMAITARLKVLSTLTHLMATTTSLALGTSQTQAIDCACHIMREVGYSQTELEPALEAIASMPTSGTPPPAPEEAAMAQQQMAAVVEELRQTKQKLLAQQMELASPLATPAGTGPPWRTGLSPAR